MKMSSNRSTGKHQSQIVLKGETDSRVPPSLRYPLRSAAGGRHTEPQTIKYERPVISEDRNTPLDKRRPKSSRPLHGDNAGQKPPSAAPSGRVKSYDQNRRTQSIEEKHSREVERYRESGDAELNSDGEEAGSRSASPKGKNETRTQCSAARPVSTTSGLTGNRISHVDSNPPPPPRVLRSDLRKGNNYYLYCLGKIYDVSDMRRRKEMQYWNLLARQRQLGFHSPKECDVYMRYLSRPRTAEYSTAYSGQRTKDRTKSTEGRKSGDESARRSRTASAAEGKGKTDASNEDRVLKASCGDNKDMAVSSKTRPVNRDTRPISSKQRAASSKPRLDSSKKIRREEDHHGNVSRDEDAGDEEINRRRDNETSDEESKTSQNEEDKTKHRRNTLSGKDQRNTKHEQSPLFDPTPKAVDSAEAGDESDGDETSDSDDSDGRSNIPHLDDGESRPVDATSSDRRNTDAASSDDDDSDSDSHRE